MAGRSGVVEDEAPIDPDSGLDVVLAVRRVRILLSTVQESPPLEDVLGVLRQTYLDR
jgi:hypothetical protein